MRFRMTVERKLFAMSGVALAFLVAVAAAGYHAVTQLSDSAGDVLTDTSALKSQMQADMAHDALRADVYAAMLAGAAGEAARQREVEADLKEHVEIFTGSLERLDALPLGPAAREAVARIRPALDDYARQSTELVALAFRDRAAVDARMSAFRDAFKHVEREMAALSDLIARRSERSRENLEASEAASRHARTVILGTLAAAAALLLAVSWFTSRQIVGRIRSAVQVAEAVAQGDLGSHIDVRGSDETAQLMAALGAMNEGLARLVGTVRDASDSIATGTAQIAAGNQDLSQRTEEQASSLEETAASMEEITASVRNSAEATRKARGLAGDASRCVGAGEAAVDQLVSTMAAITEASRRITEITGVIDGIAFQTNILALNAAVEAARAGDQGRGFAVVAAEVRALAQRSGVAAREIKELIGATVQKVGVGEQHATEAGVAMREMTGTVRAMTQLITDISVTNEEQTKGISEVTQAVANIDQTTQKNASLVEEAAAAAESLKQQAAALVHAVSIFRLRRGAETRLALAAR